MNVKRFEMGGRHHVEKSDVGGKKFAYFLQFFLCLRLEMDYFVFVFKCDMQNINESAEKTEIRRVSR